MEKKLFASSMKIAPRGSANAALLRGMKPREASAIADSISTVSTRSRSRFCSSVCVVRPVPMPITAALLVSGLSASGSAAVSTMVISSVPRSPPRSG